MLHRLIIGAPFGNYLQFPYATSTVGTYTLKQRASFWQRWWRVLTTVRYYRRLGGWVNRLGLPNPGIAELVTNCVDQRHPIGDKILSIHGFTEGEWHLLMATAYVLRPAAIELNLSCPNVRADSLAAITAAYVKADFVWNDRETLIAKLGPLDTLVCAKALADVGCTAFHLCNTLPVPAGGLSGKPLKPLSLRAVEAVRKSLGNAVTIIGGGGVTSIEDAKEYLNAGADRVSVASWLFNPFAWKRVTALAHYLRTS